MVETLNSQQLETASSMLKAMAHPMRIAILNMLDNGKQLSVTEIHEHLHIEQAVASHHLGIMKDKGLLNARRDGKNIYYSLRHDTLSHILECIAKCTPHV